MSTHEPLQPLDRRCLRRRFERAAATYDDAAHVHREVGLRLLEHLDPIRIDPRRILEIGTATGRGARSLARRYRGARVVAVDIALGMVRRARRRRRLLAGQTFVCSDAGRLGLATGSVDLVHSNTTLHWCADFDAALQEFARVLRPGGLVLFSAFGPDTLHELRESWARVDIHPHVHRFPDMHDLGDGLVRAGFQGVVMESDRLTVEYARLDELVADLRAQGETNAAPDRPRALLGRGRLEALREAYESHRRGGRLPATFEITYAHAWRARDVDATTVQVDPPGL